MADLTMSIPHCFTKEEAKEKVEELIANIQQDYGGMFGRVEKRWEGDRMTFSVSAKGVTLGGNVLVDDQAAHVDIPLPWPLPVMAGDLKNQIEHEAKRLLEKP
jgi:putative polyhydroxyalkanoate system protein